MVKAVDVLQRAAKDGAAGRSLDKDIQAYQQARLLFVNRIRVLRVHALAEVLVKYLLVAPDGILVQDHLQKDDDGTALQGLMKHGVVGLLCCPLSCGTPLYPTVQNH